MRFVFCKKIKHLHGKIFRNLSFVELAWNYLTQLSSDIPDADIVCFLVAVWRPWRCRCSGKRAHTSRVKNNEKKKQPHTLSGKSHCASVSL